MSPSDADLVKQCLRGRRRAFDELVSRYEGSVYNVCTRMLGNADEARDVAQEAFVRAYMALNRFDTERPFRPWMLKIATNVCINVAKARSRGEVSLHDPAPAGAEPAAHRLEVEDERAGPAETVQRRELHERVREAVLSLPETYRAVAVLRHLEGLSYEEVAEATGLPLGTVKTHIFRAKKLLRERLSDLFTG
ncbi:MAG: sigma-70 family RNA polymerase sigma factor [Armatimonadota bacterium]